MKNFRIIITFILAWLSCHAYAQKAPDFSSIDKVALQLPDSLARTSKDIAGFIYSHFKTSTDRSRAIYIWIANHISYDIEKATSREYYSDRKELVDRVLKTRKGVCMHYAELFADVARRMDLKSYVIGGYTKQNGKVMSLSHAWCAVFIDSSWWLLDPTWGSGYVNNSKYVRQVNDSYFKVKPEQMIKSHMPFDPLWQFLPYPVTNQEFVEGKPTIAKKKAYFNFTDSIKAYESETEITRSVSSARRIERNGVVNRLISDYLQQEKKQAEYYTNKNQAGKYNAAIDAYNKTVSQLNSFIGYRNKKFTPERSDNEIKKMLDLAEQLLNKTIAITKEIGSTTTDRELANSVTELYSAINGLTTSLNEQKKFLNKYLSTDKSLRKSLFYKTTWVRKPAK